MTFAGDIEAAAGEPVEFAVIGTDRWWEEEDRRGIPKEKKGVVLAWNEARQLLNYGYSTGFGGADCHPIYAWSEHWVLFVSEYDGSTTINRISRFPVPSYPEFA